MLKSRFLRASTAALTTLGLMFSAPHVQAASQPGQKLIVQTTDAKVIDIGLKEQGLFQGRVVDHAGTPVQGEDPVRLLLDEHGGVPGQGRRGGPAHRPGPPAALGGQLTGVEGRKIFTEGQLFAGERLCAEAEGLFVSIDVEKWRGLMEERERQGADAG